MNKTIIIGINLGDYGSTGNIMRNALEYANKYGNYDYLILVPKSEGKPNTYIYVKNNIFSKIDHHFIHRMIGRPDGLYDYSSTKRIIRIIKTKCKLYDDVIIHLHNIHMANIDFRILFKYFSGENKIKKILYTLHDAWAITGGCYCFNYIKCFKWKTGCKGKCPQNFGTKNISTNNIWNYKKAYTNLIKDKLILCPCSNWLKNMLKMSFLKNYKMLTINGESSIKKLNYKDNKLKEKLKIPQKNKVIISVSSYWNDWKGYKYLYSLSNKLPKNYSLLIVGGKFDIKNKRNMIHVPQVKQNELNKYYSIADCFVSTTQDDNLPVVIMEAQICGVPVVGFGHGGTPEEIINYKTGIMVGTDNNIKKLVNAIIYVVENKPFKPNEIIKNGDKYRKFKSSKKYFELYKN